jgi:hypothetical protein
MILWPVLVLGISGLGTAFLSMAGLVLNPESLATSSSSVDAFVYSQIGTVYPVLFVAFAGLLGVVLGYLYYNRLDVRNNNNPNAPTMMLTKRALRSVLVCVTITLFLQGVFGYPNLFLVLPERFLTTLFLIFIGAIFAMIGLGIVTDYYDLTAFGHQRNAHVEAFAVWVSESPSVVREASNLIGGAFIMLYDPRVSYALFKTVQNPPGYWKQKGVSPEKVRREQHLQM